MALDSLGNVYIADELNNAIRMVNITTLTIHTIAGNGTPIYAGEGGPATGALLDSPSGLAFDTSGTLYFANFYLEAIRMTNGANKTITMVAGKGSVGALSGVPGPAKNSVLGMPIKLISQTDQV